MKDRELRQKDFQPDLDFKKIRETEKFVPEIRIENLSFKYGSDSDLIIDSVSLEIPVGSFVAIVGPTGSGKSTLVDLILGVSDPISGVLCISGMPPRQAVQVWPGQIGFVPQTVSLNAASVRENVAIGLKPGEIDDAKVWAVLEQVRLAELLRNSREGLDTEVGERGLRFSGGQRQRLGLITDCP